MPFGGHAASGAAPFLAMGLGVGLRWLYGVVFDDPAPNNPELITSGVVIGVGLYVFAVLTPVVVGLFARKTR